MPSKPDLSPKADAPLNRSAPREEAEAISNPDPAPQRPGVAQKLPPRPDTLDYV